MTAHIAPFSMMSSTHTHAYITNQLTRNLSMNARNMACFVLMFEKEGEIS